MPPHDAAYSVARFLANTINPLLALAVVAAPLIERRIAPWLAAGAAWRKPLAYGWYLAVSGLGLTGAVALAESGKKYVVWAGHPGFPSGHETFAAATAIALVLRYRRWAVFGVPAVLLMAWALVRAGFHDVPDVCGGFALGVTIMSVTSLLSEKARPRATLPDI